MPPSVETHIIDEDIEPIDFDTEADLIGLSFMTYNAPQAYRIADKFRYEKGKTVIFGGYHPTLLPEEAIKHADAVCVGDAESNVPSMVDDFAAGRLKPFYRNPPGSLKDLPIPNRNLIQKSKYAPIDVIQATRGCHYRCSFCSIALSTIISSEPDQSTRSSKSSRPWALTFYLWTITSLVTVTMPRNCFPD